MYFKFYDFKEPPFNLTPNSKFFYSSTKHVEALSTLIYAINERKGFVVITGDIGSGKTTVCRALINELDANTQTALITNTRMSGKDLLMAILDDFEVEYEPGSKSQLHSQLNDYLIDQLSKDNNVVLIIDEAQNLSPAVMEEIRMLSNLETENEKLIQIIFLGQPELKKKLSLGRLEQLRQRIAVYYHLTPLSEADTYKYIIHRCQIAGNKKRKYFTDDALKAVYRFSKGVPRLINQICDSAFLTGFINEVKVIDIKILTEVIKESPMMQLSGTDKSKYFEDEKDVFIENENGDSKANLNEENPKEDKNGFTLTEQYMAQDEPYEPARKEIIEDQQIEGTKDVAINNEIWQVEKLLEEPLPAELTEESQDENEVNEEFGEQERFVNSANNEDSSNTEIEMAQEEEHLREHIGHFEDTGHLKSNMHTPNFANSLNKAENHVENKLPILMMILFSIFVVATIIIFYEMI